MNIMSSRSIYFSGINNIPPASRPEEDSGEVCIPNISPKERKKRVQFATRYFIFTLLVLGILIEFDVNPLWRLPLFFMFSAAATSYIQALDKT